MMNASMGVVVFMLMEILHLTDSVEGASRDDPTVDRKLKLQPGPGWYQLTITCEL